MIERGQESQQNHKGIGVTESNTSNFSLIWGYVDWERVFVCNARSCKDRLGMTWIRDGTGALQHDYHFLGLVAWRDVESNMPRGSIVAHTTEVLQNLRC